MHSTNKIYSHVGCIANKSEIQIRPKNRLKKKCTEVISVERKKKKKKSGKKWRNMETRHENNKNYSRICKDRYPVFTDFDSSLSVPLIFLTIINE